MGSLFFLLHKAILRKCKVLSLATSFFLTQVVIHPRVLILFSMIVMTEKYHNYLFSENCASTLEKKTQDDNILLLFTSCSSACRIFQS
jgi:hypothetical protein